MKFSFSRYPKSIWAWLFWGLCMYLALELGPFFIVRQVLHKTVGQLAGPYLAFAVPMAIFLPLVWWLLKWEKEKRASAKKLARGWGLMMVLFGVTVAGAVFYSGIKLGLVDMSDAVISFVVGVLYSGLIFYFGMYHLMLRRISARVAGRNDERSLNECPK